MMIELFQLSEKRDYVVEEEKSIFFQMYLRTLSNDFSLCGKIT